uniref:hypothetical protein n=1 Tax=Cupriavidus pinatubonensis TaxID=248026 RepID=UPI001CC7FC9C|nr:hypothetical protein [Cupriavidus pinatubonensis]
MIGQARIDTALFPVSRAATLKGGSKRVYGERLNAEAIETLPAIELHMTPYAKSSRFDCALPRPERVSSRARWRVPSLPVLQWEETLWRKPRLLLASETDLSVQEIVQLYARR